MMKLRGMVFIVAGRRCFGAKVGEKIPVSFIKDAPTPAIKPDSEYPEWVFRLTERLPSKNVLVAKLEKVGLEAMTERELMRTKRLMTLETIRKNNLSSKSVGA